MGIHKPLALHYLVSEGILPPDPPENLYNWEISHDRESGRYEEEELLTTSNCVIWSKCGVIRRIFRFDIERETVVQAAFTRFAASQSVTNLLVHSDLSVSRDGVYTKETGGFNISHQQTQGLDPTGIPQSKINRELHEQDAVLPEDAGDGRRRFERAIVVVLKTQAHVYFLAGSSHVVHLPFEVEAIFPLPEGLLLQRRYTPDIRVQPTPIPPPAPLNSFAFSHPGSSWTVPASPSLPHVPPLQMNNRSSRPFAALIESVFSQSRTSADLGLPRSFCLTDPLAEIGLVIVSERSQKRTSSNSRTSSNIDNAETFLYLSSHEELPSRCSRSSPNPFLLAVTANQETNAYNLWTVTYIGNKSLIYKAPHKPSFKNGVRSQRRSSHGPGVRTGASTPGIRNSLGPRESIGQTKEGKAGPNSIKDDIGLAVQLDTAFENPGEPDKASRRVSSLLARADLSTSRDRFTYNEFIGAQNNVATTRRGASLGGRVMRSSIGPYVGNGSLAGAHINSSQGTHNLTESVDDPEIDMLQDSDSDDALENIGSTGPGIQLQSLGQQIVLKKIYGISDENGKSRASVITSQKGRRTKVFCLRPPAWKNEPGLEETYVCIVDYETGQLTVLQIDAFVPRKISRLNGGRKIVVTDVKRGGGILDACQIFDGFHSRILVLEQSEDGFGEITLRVPWSTLIKVRLPPTLLIYDPYQLDHCGSPGRHRGGGFKRVISQGPESLSALHQGSGGNSVDIIDQQGTRHRVKIQLSPANHLVRDLISVCHLVLPSDAVEREPILRAWWDAVGWLQNRSEIVDLEWVAFIVVMFSLAASLTLDGHIQNTTRQRRQKGGLLRSGNRASIDPANWDKMELKEGHHCGSSPFWAHDSSWDWIAEEGLLSSTNSSNHQLHQSRHSTAIVGQISQKSTFFWDCFNTAKEFVSSTTGQLAFGPHGYFHTTFCKDTESRLAALQQILLGLHLYREEQKLNVLATNSLHTITPVLAQLGGWLGWELWSWRSSSFYVLESPDIDHWLFDESRFSRPQAMGDAPDPPSIFNYIENFGRTPSSSRFPTLLDITTHSSASSAGTHPYLGFVKSLTPRTLMVLELLYSQVGHNAVQISQVVGLGFDLCVLESLPEGIASSLYALIFSCRMSPVSTWSPSILALIGRDDTRLSEERSQIRPILRSTLRYRAHEATEDISAIIQKPAHNTDKSGEYDFSPEQDREVITKMVFSKDQRFDDAARILHPVQPSAAYCKPEPHWSDTELLDAQKELVKRIAIRTLSVPPGRGMIFYNEHKPLLTEKVDIHGFVLSCIMKPANTTIVADKSEYTEEKISWAFFHAGVEVGLRISKKAKGINTSWILFNKPQDLNLRHAGFLMALGLNGHLRSVPRWVAFKYLAPKHEVTSIGLLLGLAASFLGTMDDVVTRLLSIHVIRMLPPGAAPLNISPLTQTTGIMALGLLYCNTQHRRMSEVMVSEMENIEYDDTNKLKSNFRDEGYRLAAGFALGYINLGQGKYLRGLHDMRIVDRLLTLAMGTKRVSIAHVFDKSTSAAIVAIALIFMKCHDRALAKKIDIPDTKHQFEHVRPDNFLLRTVARHLIMWDDIIPTLKWMQEHVPKIYQSRVSLKRMQILSSNDIPLYDIITGLCLSIGLRYAGTARLDVRELLVEFLDQYIRICRLPANTYDGKLARTAIRNCQDVTALSAAMVMAGTGDLEVFRRLRSLHGRTDADTPYGSHLAAHMAIGALFLGGGTHTFGTSNLAVASLLCAFYPLFPATVQDNQCHLQAWRHFWVLATEARCAVVRNVDTHHPIPMGITVALRSGTEIAASSPCLLPDLDAVASVAISDQGYWPATLDFVNNPAHLLSFRDHQNIYVRQKAAYDAHDSVFNTTLQALNDTQSIGQTVIQVVDWLYQLPSLRHFDVAERALVLPSPDTAVALQKLIRTTIVDDRLVLETACLESGRAERLWNLRLLFAWADSAKKKGERLGWLGEEVVEGLRAALWLKIREVGIEGMDG